MTKMAALSLWQPWASLIAQGHKEFETRNWATNHRGEILICAAKKKIPRESYHYLNWELKDAGVKLTLNPNKFPLGVAVAIANLVGCYEVNRDPSWISQKELCLGDWSPGRYVWKMADVRPLQPFPVKGQQGVFYVEVDDELISV